MVIMIHQIGMIILSCIILDINTTTNPSLSIHINRTITVGKTLIGSDHPVAKQTMTTTNTRDVEASVQQVNSYLSILSSE